MAMIRERRQLRLLMPPPPPPSMHHEQLSGLPSTPPGSPGPVIDHLADLERLDVLGHGTGGTVYKARHCRTGAVFALKALRLDAADAALREAGVLLRIADDSPSIVRLHGVFSGDCASDHFLCLLLEFMPGGSLRDVLRRQQRLPEPAIAGVARCVLQGLHHLHRGGIVHGDIKPSNLLIGRKGEVKISDFGASRVVSSATSGAQASTDASAGTCAYMSPERFDSEGFNAMTASAAEAGGFAGDVWALGVVLLECHVGRFPLVAAGERPDLPTLVSTVCFGRAPELPVAASPEFRSFVGRCLEKDWRRRGTVAELLGHPFVTNSCYSHECCLITTFDDAC